MAKNYTISGNPSKGYRSVADNGQRASFIGRTQAEVVNQTRQTMRQNGGGELRIQNIKGQYRAADTVPPKKIIFRQEGKPWKSFALTRTNKITATMKYIENA